MSTSRAQALTSAPLPCSDEVLLLVDVINPMSFPTADDLLPSAWAAAQRVARLKKRLAARGVTAIYANDNYGTWHSEFRDILGACQMLPGPRGDIARLLTPTPDDLVILKPQHSAFHSTPLRHLLTQMGTKKLTIVGWAADMCVMLSATDACMYGYEVWVPQDCIAAETVERFDMAVKQLGGAFDCSVRPAFRADLRAGAPPQRV
ncbi:cysteine hydrolase family protein [Pulveribacter suum]|uniref:Cysteine hydrolase n=1 Tax=Pulveribacter suum TaxID=2116657 RepID=A0A2P1NIW8_9BURK|nr:isochorismatase family cysteine hydrolase [Pulveribacter suum]AVP57014.1 cysteine hydrolase [Pulveribacter suum]